MVRENIRLSEGNFTSDGTYFYTMLDGSQALQQKVDDGSVAFSFPLDTAVAGNIKELEWDGVYFWTLEDRSGGDGVTIRRWGIESFICKQQGKHEFIDGTPHTYNSDAFALEHYTLTVGINHNDDGDTRYTWGATDIHISDTSMLESGDVLTFVRRFTSPAQRVGTSFVEQRIVNNVINSTQVSLTVAMTGDPHGDGAGFRGPDLDSDSLGGPPTPDLVYVTKNIWLANDDSPNDPGTPSIYKIRADSYDNLIQFSGTQYDDVNGMAFYTKYVYALGIDDDVTPYPTTVVTDSGAGGRQTYLLISRGEVLLFFNTTTNVVDRSLIMNNIKASTTSSWPVFDMWVGGIEPNIVLYRLQLGTTYNNGATDASWSSYNYEKQLLRRVVSSIAVSVEPSIIPANGGGSDAQVTATLRDQYNDTVPAAVNVQWNDDADGDGALDDTDAVTDEFGVSRNRYGSGSTEKDVKITASVVNGLLP